MSAILLLVIVRNKEVWGLGDLQWHNIDTRCEESMFFQKGRTQPTLFP